MFLDISADILFLGFKHLLQPWERMGMTAVLWNWGVRKRVRRCKVAIVAAERKPD